jgi:ABC-type multidrug transport system fused ATPase/permease subunit
MIQIFCPECGKPFDGQFALSYHRKLAHSIDDSVDNINKFFSEDLEKANKRIKGAVIAGIISGVITLIFTLITMSDIGLWGLLDVALISGLTFGVYKKNRTCAVILFAYWIVNKIFQLSYMDTNFFWWFVAGLFTVYFFQGILGTFLYQKTIKETKRNKYTGIQANLPPEKSTYPSDGEELEIYPGSREYGQKNQF